MLFRSILFLLCAAISGAAEYTIPSDRLPATGTWQAAGVPGGITHRTTIYTTLTATGSDQATEIQTALTNCPSGQVVKLNAGTFRIDVNVRVPSNVTLRGATDANGVPTVIFDARGGVGLTVGTNSLDFDQPGAGANLVVASLTKGATTIQVDDATYVGAGHLALIECGLDSSFPLVNVYGTQRGRGQVVKVVSVNTAASPDEITIEAPGLHGDYTTSETATLQGNQGLHVTGAGLEDIKVTGINSGNVMENGLGLEGCYASWIKNCTSEYAKNYGLTISSGYPGAYRCEVRGCRITGQDEVGNSKTGIIMTGASSNLIINNIIEEWRFATLFNVWCSGNVIADNLWINITNGSMVVDGNHQPAPQFTLYESNVGHAWQSDGLNGGSLYDTHYRNWWMGKALGVSGDLYSIVGNRYTRFLNIVGNQFGKTGVAAAPPQGFGNPNMGNGASTNAVSRRSTASTLTTRTNATSGVITAPTGHGVTTGATIDLIWMEFDGTYNYAQVRRNVAVGTVSGDSIPFSGGEGDDLPDAAETVYVPTSNSALWDNDVDFDAAEGREKHWPGTLTTRTTDAAGVITLDSGHAASFTAGWDDALNGQRGLRLANPVTWIAQINVTGISGNDVTFDTSSFTLPTAGTSILLTPSNFGLQGLDLDVLLTAILKGNHHGKASGSGIPAVESLAGDTLPDSLFRTGTPTHYAGFTYPPINAASPTDTSYEIIPAGYRYVNGYDLGSGGTTITTGTLRIGAP